MRREEEQPKKSCVFMISENRVPANGMAIKFIARKMVEVEIEDTNVES